jgi:hypothetical protein
MYVQYMCFFVSVPYQMTASVAWWSEFLATIVGLERGPLSLASTTEELLDRKVADPV